MATYTSMQAFRHVAETEPDMTRRINGQQVSVCGWAQPAANFRPSALPPCGACARRLQWRADVLEFGHDGAVARVEAREAAERAANRKIGFVVREGGKEPTIYVGAVERPDGYNGATAVVHVVLSITGVAYVVHPTGFHAIPADQSAAFLLADLGVAP